MTTLRHALAILATALALAMATVACHDAYLAATIKCVNQASSRAQADACRARLQDGGAHDAAIKDGGAHD